MEDVKNFFAALVCRFKGHRRGRRIESINNGTSKCFQCPRCKRVTTYKAKAA